MPARWTEPFLVVVILANYLAQVPYDLHLYGTRFNPVGAAMLVLTAIWFLAGLVLLRRGHPAGYWLTLSFLIVDFGFYLYNIVAGTIHGYGPLYHLANMRDPILWAVFLVGYLNFLAAGGLVWQLARRGARTRTVPARA